LSGFAVVYERSNTPGDPGVFSRVMERLNHRGPDGNDILVAGNVSMGHWHFWTTPEEVGERQPLQLAGMPFRIVFDGRLDNRAELFAELGMTPPERETLSDAALTLLAYARWGEACLEHFVGEYAWVICDEPRDRLLCARDAMGDRTLFYSADGVRVVIASEPWAVAGANGLEAELHETAVAHYFALRATGDGQTLFKSVYELLPAHAMRVNSAGLRKWRYWQPDPSRRLVGESDAEYAEQFRSLLEESVRCRMRSTSPVGVLMSGGLDSTSVACLAAQMLAPAPLTTVSYVFDELADCDERAYISAVQEQWGTNSIQIPCDDAWPYRDWATWPRNPNQPEGNPYRLLKERAYGRAHQEGLRVMLTGAFGDHLYSGAEDWLADLIMDGRLLQAWQELARHLPSLGLRRTLMAKHVRRVARRMLDMLPGGRHLRRRNTRYPWLVPNSLSEAAKKESRLDSAFESKANLLGLRAAESCTAEISNASRHALEFRHPYRDRRLVEFVLRLPSCPCFLAESNAKVPACKQEFKIPRPLGEGTYRVNGFSETGMSRCRLRRMALKHWYPGYVFPMRHGINLWYREANLLERFL